MSRRSLRYYLCQFAGWGLLLLALYLLGPGQLVKAAVTVGAGLVASHLLRGVILRFGWFKLPMKRLWVRLIVGGLLTCVFASVMRTMCVVLLEESTFSAPRLVVLTMMLDYPLLLLPWLGIYYLHYYINACYAENFRKKMLEQKVEEMKRQSVSSGTDMGVIMDSLKRIQDLIERDPVQSRLEITEFSNLLRKGYIHS